MDLELIKDIMKARIKGAWCGACLALCAMSLFQDIVGQDRYVEIVNHYWVSEYISVPIVTIIGWLMLRELMSPPREE